MRIAFVGAGSYVFGPSVLVQLLRSGLHDVELRLIDPAEETIALLCDAFRTAATGRGKWFEVSGHASHVGALTGVDFVIHSAAPGMLSQFARDREIVQRHDPSHLLTEFGGVHGIAYSVTQGRFMRELAAEMRGACPQARLLVSTNPLPRVCTVAQREGISTIGMCSVALVGYRTAWHLLTGEWLDYPFTAARGALDLQTAGTNHLSWIVRLTDRRTGEDLLPRLPPFGDVQSPSKTLRMLARTGFLLAPGDDHTQDFLEPEGIEPGLTEPSHGNPAARAQRLEHLRAIARGEAEFETLDEHPSWEEPIPIIEALTGGPATYQPTLNLPNAGAIPELPNAAVVEAPAQVTADGAALVAQSLPEPCLPFAQRAVALTEAIADFIGGEEGALPSAVELDPTIRDKAKGLAALRECLAGI